MEAEMGEVETNPDLIGIHRPCLSAGKHSCRSIGEVMYRGRRGRGLLHCPLKMIKLGLLVFCSGLKM